jgi:hypothetical protein
MTKVLKKPAAWNFPKPKRGKAMMINNQKVNMKKVKQNKGYNKTPYVRHGQATKKSRPERQRLLRTLKDFWKATDKQLIDMLQKDGVLPDLKGTACSVCGQGKLGKFKHYAAKGWQYRCNRFGCQRYFLAHANHPVFHFGHMSLHI